MSHVHLIPYTNCEHAKQLKPKAIFTLYRMLPDGFCADTKTIHFKNVNFGAVSVTERDCAAPRWRVTYRRDRCSYYTVVADPGGGSGGSGLPYPT